MIQLTAASLVKVSPLPRMLGQVNHDDTLSLEIDHGWHSRALQRKINESTLDRVRGEHTLLMNFTFFLLVIYIFVTIQLLNVCLVLFLTLLYIRTQI